MGDGGFEWSIYEIFEVIIATSMLLVISAAILFAPQIENIENKIITTELAYVTNLITDTNLKTKINHQNIEINLKENLIEVTNTKEEITTQKEIYGQNHRIEKMTDTSYCITSNEICDSSNSNAINLNQQNLVKIEEETN